MSHAVLSGPAQVCARLSHVLALMLILPSAPPQELKKQMEKSWKEYDVKM